eukprot:SAG31_NODE_584_length_13886_cov_96.615000_12_plen_84_part_00
MRTTLPYEPLYGDVFPASRYAHRIRTAYLYCGNTIVGPPPPHLWGAFGGTFVQYLYEYFVQYLYQYICPVLLSNIGLPFCGRL